jgi:hypothetical protein
LWLSTWFAKEKAGACSPRIAHSRSFAPTAQAKCWRSGNLPIDRAAFETAKRMYPKDVLEYRRGDEVLERRLASVEIAVESDSKSSTGLGGLEVPNRPLMAYMAGCISPVSETGGSVLIRAACVFEGRPALPYSCLPRRVTSV